ncbi:lysozyme family protein [Bacillus sp. ISL-4]|uniref:lysozyme family protein n=1 Tax=Bacillus sp. ISL-4 TaxID=2819125 RepID=UPI001BE8FCA2|nr:lysozyme family protein [Bacillus sp. ISL-4]MBT2668639.1 lysozyme family protein [Bacillus sp. ISL-4]MBT2673387.1 lysozyme family protein [Streptomyces sp. ISL-14]
MSQLANVAKNTAKTAIKGALLKNPYTWLVMAIGLFLAGLVAIVALYLMAYSNEEGAESNTSGEFIPGGTALISPDVLRYEPLVRKYALENGVEEHVPLLLAKIMQESGGRVPDVMQSSESLGFPPNTIMDPEYSIKVGVAYFADILKKAKGDIKLTLQSYNFGGGFIDYALDRGGYSKAVAVEFSNMMAAKQGWDRYGDVNYVENVLRYMPNTNAIPVNAKGFLLPINQVRITSQFGMRVNPVTGVYKLHAGSDFGCQRGDAIYSTKEGKVTKAGWQDPGNPKAGYGQRVTIQHGSNLETLYAHLSAINVKAGQTVKAGQQIGACGTTGSSTGNHLHFEIALNGKKVDPLPYVSSGK